MSFLKRAIRDGISKGISDAVGKAVTQAVEPRAAQWANKTAEQLDQASQSKSREVRQSFSGLEGAFANLQRAAENYATEIGKSVKICPGCGEPVSADKKFCPGCGAQLPETSVAQGALCTACGRQNTVGMKFCDACGAKLPAAVAEEEAAAKRMEESLSRWEAVLSMYPVWSCGGTELYIEQHDPEECGGCFATVSVSFPKGSSGQLPLQQYWDILKADGFRTAGRYPDSSHLYKKIGSTCYLASSEHAFDGGTDNLYLEFAVREPDGGFDYVRPEPKQQSPLKDIRNQFASGKDLDELKDGIKDLKNLFRR